MTGARDLGRFEVLSEEECLDLLRTHPVGRVAWVIRILIGEVSGRLVVRED